MTTPLLTGSSAGTVDLRGTNNIAAVGASTASPFSAVGQSFTLVDAGAASLTGERGERCGGQPDRAHHHHPGVLTGTASVNLAATSGGISETGRSRHPC